MISQYPLGKHRSNAQTLINKVPVIEVEGYQAGSCLIITITKYRIIFILLHACFSL